MAPGESSTEELKRHHQSLKRARDKEEMEGINSTLSPDVLRLVNQSRDKGMPLESSISFENCHDELVSYFRRPNGGKKFFSSQIIFRVMVIY